MEITRQNLVESLNKINEQIKECKSKKFNYVTGERYLTGWAIICKVQDNKELVEILTYLLGQKSDTSEAEKLLGIVTEKDKLKERISEYKSILGDLYEEINLYEGWLKEAEDELSNL